MLILFIDDDSEDYELFCEAMKEIRPDVDCIFRSDGATGLKYLQTSTELPDYVFLDIRMPVMGGLECLKKIKADERLKRIPVIIYSSDTKVNNYRDLGAAHFITKPSSFPEIVKVLRALIG